MEIWSLCERSTNISLVNIHAILYMYKNISHYCSWRRKERTMNPASPLGPRPYRKLAYWYFYHYPRTCSGDCFRRSCCILCHHKDIVAHNFLLERRQEYKERECVYAHHQALPRSLNCSSASSCDSDDLCKLIWIDWGRFGNCFWVRAHGQLFDRS